MNKELQTIMRIMESLVKMNKWTVERFDIQGFNYGSGISGYAGYLHITGKNEHLVIRCDGSFEWLE